MARRGQRQTGARRTAPRNQRRVRDRDDVISVLARAVREVEAAVQRGRVTPAVRTKFQAVALLVREERARVKADEAISDTHRAEQLKRLDGIATILAKTAVRDTGLLALLAEDAVVSDAARSLTREMLRAAGIEPPPRRPRRRSPRAAPAAPERRVVPQSVVSRQLANPFLAPDFAAARQTPARPRRLAGWELLGPLLQLLRARRRRSPGVHGPARAVLAARAGGLELMPHQAQLVAAAAAGHRTFLLADEPGLGKTAQALLAAEAANAYPLLVVVPNVVKTNWAREAGRWTPHRTATVIHGNGETIDGFADIVVVNYEVLDRHVGWLGDFGFRGMVVDEAHFIKNKTSQRSQHVLELSERIRSRTARPLLMALTGTPLINDIEDFRAIWQFLGWIDEAQAARRADGRARGDRPDAGRPGLLPGRPRVRHRPRHRPPPQGRRRRRHPRPPHRRPARRARRAGRPLDPRGRARARPPAWWRGTRPRSPTARPDVVEGIDHDLVRRVAGWELKDATTSTTGENVFSMVRRIGQAKAGLAADYAAQLARSAGKVVFFAKHVDVMDAAEETFARQGIRYSSIRGDQTPTARQKNIDAFVNDPDVAIAVCSLTAAGVGLNLQVASNIVLAELSWTDAEQTQAIDRSHRIGQTEPVTAWRIIAAQTIDARIAELIDSKAGLAARALDGSDEEVSSSADVQLEALVALLTDALSAAPQGRAASPTGH